MSDTDSEFKRMVAYYWTEKGDPTRWNGWDAGRCKKIMPAFYEAWSKYTVYGKLATLAANAAESEAETAEGSQS